MGDRLRLARRRRGITEAEMAERILASRPTVRKLEAGDLSVSLAVLAQVLEVLGLDADLGRIAERDDLGQRLADARLPRPRRRDEPTLADEL
jgi:transcriptional regulator with XRE-family HTH domain